MLDGCSAAKRFDHFVNGSLFPGACEGFISLQKRGNFSAETKHHTERNDVVISHPPGQLEQRSTHGWLRIGRLENRLWPALEWTDIGQSDTDPDFLVVPQRHHDARADRNWIRQPVFNCVCKCLEERERQRDLDEARRSLTHFGTPLKDPRLARESRRVRRHR